MTIKISEMPSATALTGAELVPIVQGGANKKVTVAVLVTPGVPFLAADGSAAAPSYSFLTNPALGFYKQSTSAISFAAAGAEQIRFQPSAISILSNTALLRMGASNDVILARQSAGVLALKNAANAQEFQVNGAADSYISLSHNGSLGRVLSTDGPVRIGTGTVSASRTVALETAAVTASTNRTRYVTDEDAAFGQGWEIVNGALSVTVAGNNLTVALKTKAGTDPSATDPVLVKFRDPTTGNGTYVVRTVTNALSVVVPNGATLGTLNATLSRIYVVLGDDAGVVKLGVYNPLNYGPPIGSIRRLRQNQQYTSLAVSTGADNEQTIYSTAGWTNKYVVYVGYFEISEATAGVWATAPALIQILAPNDPISGDIVGSNIVTSTAVVTGTSVTPVDDTVPQSSETTQGLTTNMSPLKEGNILRVRASAFIASSFAGNSAKTLAIFIGSDPNAKAACGASSAQNVPTLLYVAANVYISSSFAGTTALSSGFGANSAGTTTFGGAAAAGYYGTTPACTIEWEEVFV